MNGTKHDTEAAGLLGFQIADFRLQIEREDRVPRGIPGGAVFVFQSKICDLQSEILTNGRRALQ
jgi:hypothetical protein